MCACLHFACIHYIELEQAISELFLVVLKKDENTIKLPHTEGEKFISRNAKIQVILNKNNKNSKIKVNVVNPLTSLSREYKRSTFCRIQCRFS